MRIEHLAIEGFGPFAGRQEIDFGPLDDAGVFLITGRTGAGKSSILDAICFALYGTAPRYDGGLARLRSDHAAIDAPTTVELVFTLAGDRWRIVRSPDYDRPKRRGTGTTPQKATATLERWEGDGWAGVAARPVDVAEHLVPVLQLTCEQFLQVILLAQGRFQEFLRARSEDRLGLLRALFGTERFQQFEAEVTERAKTLQNAVASRAAELHADVVRLGRSAGIEAPPGAGAAWASTVAARLTDEAKAAELAAAAAQTTFDLADRAAADATALADRQRRRESAERLLAGLDDRRGEVDAARLRIAEALRVLPVVPAIEAADAATAATTTAQREVAAAEVAAGEPVADPTAVGEELDGLIGALAGPLGDERNLPGLDRAIVRANLQHSEAGRAVAQVAAEAQRLPGIRAALHETYARSEVVAAGSAQAEATRTAAAAVAVAVTGALRTAALVTETERDLDAALAEEEAALGHARRLLRRRLDGAAGLLAAALTPGDPCPVCGAPEHPAPAVGDGTTPDDAAVAAADAAQARAAERSAQARRAAAEARASHAEALAASGGASEATATDAVRSAEDALAICRAATAELDRVGRELERVTDRQAELDRALDEARSLEADSTGRLASAIADRAAAVDRIAAARAQSASVADRVAQLSTRRTVVRALDDAARRASTAAAEAVRARQRLEAALMEADVPDTATARSAAMPRSDRAGLEQQVRAWETARDGALAQLADPDVAAAPSEPADVAGTAAAKAAALADRIAAGDRRAAARSAMTVAAELVGAITSADSVLADDRAQLEVVGPLAEVVRGGGSNDRRMRLESYVLAARLEQIVTAANSRLTTMTDGRFSLRHDDGVAYRGARSGLGLEVLDEHTGRPRPVASLSGGETFLASLSLALGLAEVVSAEAGGIRLDTLFVDEGFGSLDVRTLDTAMETLDSLRAGGRTVGLISHVETMQEAIPAGLHVERLPDGSSAVRSRLPAPV